MKHLRCHVFSASIGIAVASLLAGCSSAPAPLPENYQVDSAELFLSRTNLTDTDFEQYKLTGEKLFVECGRIRRGRFMPQAQNIFTLEPEQRKSITFAAAETSRYLEHSFDSPGDNSSLFDPGQAYLTITTNDTTTQIKTSVDALSAQNSNAETAMYKLASGLRSASGGTVCGNRTFYGIR